MKVSEPSAAYNTPYLQGLKNRLIASIDETNDEEKLQECLELLHEKDYALLFLQKRSWMKKLDSLKQAALLLMKK